MHVMALPSSQLTVGWLLQQESGASQSGSDDVPKRGFGGVLLRGKKPKKGRTDAAEKEVAKSGSER